MIKVFALNKNEKIELTKQELEQLLNESYWEGYRNKNYWTYNSPSITTTPTPISYNTSIKNPYTITGNSSISTDTNCITIKTTSDINNTTNTIR